MPTARPRPPSRQQAYRQPFDFPSVTVDTTFKFDNIKLHSVRVERVWMVLPAGLAANAVNFCAFKLIKGASTVIGSFSTVAGGAPGTGSIGPNGAVNFLLSTNTPDLFLADGDALSLLLDVTGTVTVPAGRLVVTGTEL